MSVFRITAIYTKEILQMPYQSSDLHETHCAILSAVFVQVFKQRGHNLKLYTSKCPTNDLFNFRAS